MPETSFIVSKVWNYAHVLKNAGVGYGDYIEQITYEELIARDKANLDILWLKEDSENLPPNSPKK